MRFLKSAAINGLVVVLSLAFCFGVLEVGLRLAPLVLVAPTAPAAPAATSAPALDQSAKTLPEPPPELLAIERSRHALLNLPDAWKLRHVAAPKTASEFWWHGVLHVHDANGFRFTGPIPPKRADTFRVVVVGDSLTYGDGIEPGARFSNLVQDWLGRDFRIEVLNLGHDGYQSEDVRDMVRRFVPALKPDLVLYAICLNDFLPSGVGQYDDRERFAVPLPKRFKDFMLAHSRAAAFTSDLYDGALRRLHLRADFWDDIMRNFGGWQQRFGRDIAEMNRIVRSAGLPPLVGMVIDQYPVYERYGYPMAKVAERALVAGGAEVIPTEDYYRQFSNRGMSVSRWEGHPDEVANWIWATMIARALSGRQDLARYRR